MAGSKGTCKLYRSEVQARHDRILCLGSHWAEVKVLPEPALLIWGSGSHPSSFRLLTEFNPLWLQD